MGINTLQPRLAFVPCLTSETGAAAAGGGLQRNRGVGVASFAVSVYRLFRPGSEGKPVLAWTASGLSAGSAAGTRVQVGIELVPAATYLW